MEIEYNEARVFSTEHTFQGGVLQRGPASTHLFVKSVNRRLGRISSALLLMLVVWTSFGTHHADARQPVVPSDSTLSRQVAEGLVIRALTAQRIGRLDKAISFAENASMILKGDPDVLSLLSELHFENGDRESALYFAQQAKNESSDLVYQIDLSEMLVELGELEKADAEVRSSLTAYPNSVELRLLQATIDWELARPKETIDNLNSIPHPLTGDTNLYAQIVQLYAQVAEPRGLLFASDWIALDPIGIEPRLALIQLLTALGRDDQVASAIEDAGRLHPGNHELIAASDRGSTNTVAPISDSADTLLSALGGPALSYPLDRSSLHALIKSLESRPAGNLTGNEVDRLGLLLLRTGRPDKALSLLSPALAMDVASERRWVLVTEAQRRLGLFGDAALTCLDGRLFFPGSIDLIVECALSSLQNGDVENAELLLTEARQSADVSPPLNPLQARLGIVAAVLSATRGERATATTFVTSSTRMSQNDPFVLAQSAVVHQLLGNNSESISFTERAVALDADSEEILQIAGRIYLTQNRYEEAESALQQVSNVVTANAHVYEMLGDTAVGLQDTARALAAYQRAVAIDPTNGSLTAKIEALSNQDD